MPIIDLQRRHAEQGRIRLGVKAPVGTSGKTRPAKLDRFRFTSASERLIRSIATLYGGEPQPWDNNGLGQWEVITDATSIPVIVVKGGMSQWYETWTGGGCVHRCDGQHNVLTDTDCDLDDPDHRNAKPTTRLSVMLRDVETLGVWRLETHGWNAAVELPTIAELAAHVADLVPAWLNLEERRVVKDGQTSRFVVPVLDLGVTKTRLIEIAAAASGNAPAIDAPDVKQIEAPATESLLPVYEDQITACQTREEVNALWVEIRDAGHLFDDVKAALIERGTAILDGGTPEWDAMLKEQERAPLPVGATVAAAGAEEEPTGVDAQVVHLSDPIEDDAAWIEVVKAAGVAGMGVDQLMAEYESWAGHPVDQGNAAEYHRFLAEGSLS